MRCPGEGCLICESGDPPRVFMYIFVEIENGDVLVFEIPERMRALALELEGSLYEGPGCQLSIFRDGTALNSKIDARVVGFEACEELDIWSFVSTLGNRTAGQLPQDSENSASESKPERLHASLAK